MENAENIKKAGPAASVDATGTTSPAPAGTDILQNDPESIKFRRDSNTLVILGIGVIMFAFWSIIKLLMQLLLNIKIFPEDLEKEYGPFIILISMVVLVIIMAVDVLIRLFVGLRACRDGRGVKVSKAYLIFNVLLIMGSLVSVFFVLQSIESAEGDFIDNYIGLLMELSSLFVSVEVLLAGISVRRYRRRMKEGRK